MSGRVGSNRFSGCFALLVLPGVCMAAKELPPSQGAGSPAVAPVTFNKDVAPILYANCVTCHRPGEVLAMVALLDYARDAKKHAKEIAELTESRAMPPWKPEPGHGDFTGVRRLNEQQIGVIQQWVKQGKLEGDAADKPQAPKFSGGWALGEPDLVVKMPKAYTLRVGWAG